VLNPSRCTVVRPLGKLFTLVCLCHQAVQLGTSGGSVMPRSQEGNRRSGGSYTGLASVEFVVYTTCAVKDRPLTAQPLLRSVATLPFYLPTFIAYVFCALTGRNVLDINVKHLHNPSLLAKNERSCIIKLLLVR